MFLGKFMGFIRKLFFSNEELIKRIAKSDSLMFYYLNLFLLFVILLTSRASEVNQPERFDQTDYYFYFLVIVCLAHPIIAFLKKRFLDVRFWKGTLLSITSNISRFLAMYIILMGVEFLFHGTLIHFSFLGKRTLTVIDPYIEFVCWIYLYYMLINFIFLFLQAEKKQMVD